MHVINNTPETLIFKYGNEIISLNSGDIFEFESFNFNNQIEISKLVKEGLLTFYDIEDYEEIIPSDLDDNINNSKNIINNSKIKPFINLNFNKSNLD